MIPKKSKQKQAAPPPISFGVEEHVFHPMTDGNLVNLKTGQLIDKMPPTNQETWLKITPKV